MNIRCSKCGKNVSNIIIPDNTMIRAYIMCPECLEKETDYEAKISFYKKKLIN